MIKKWIVMAHRSAASVLGRAEAPCKGADGKILEFETSGSAEAYRNLLTAGCRSGNVFYTVCPRQDWQDAPPGVTVNQWQNRITSVAQLDP